MRRAALNCIKSVVTKNNAKSIVEDILQAIEDLEFGVEPEPEEEEKKVEKDRVSIFIFNLQSNSKEESNTTQQNNFESEKLDDEDENFEEIKKKTVRNFSDADKSYRDLQIKTVLSILIDNDYDNLDGDFQWCIEVMLKLGVYQSPRINRLVAETLRQLFIGLDDTNRKTGIEKIVKTFLAAIASTKNTYSLNCSEEFLEMLCYVISQNSFSVGANNSARILEYLRKNKDIFVDNLSTIKMSLCELIFRLSIIELQNNINKGREADIFFDRLKLFRTLMIEADLSVMSVDMRNSVYFNILNNLAENLQTLSQSGNIKSLLEHISDLESFYNDELIIGGSKHQALIEAPDCLDEEFEVNEDEIDFKSSKSKEKSLIKEDSAKPTSENTSPKEEAKTGSMQVNGTSDDKKDGDQSD